MSAGQAPAVKSGGRVPSLCRGATHRSGAPRGGAASDDYGRQAREREDRESRPGRHKPSRRCEEAPRPPQRRRGRGSTGALLLAWSSPRPGRKMVKDSETSQSAFSAAPRAELAGCLVENAQFGAPRLVRPCFTRALSFVGQPAAQRGVCVRCQLTDPSVGGFDDAAAGGRDETRQLLPLVISSTH